MERTSASGKEMAMAARKEQHGDQRLILLKAPIPDGSLDYWRRYFGYEKADIFELIDRAIQVAAVDFPGEFNARKVQIAECLFSTGHSQCSVCEEELVQLRDDGERERMDKAVYPSNERKKELNITDADSFHLESQTMDEPTREEMLANFKNCNPKSKALTEPTRKEAIVNKQSHKRKNPEEVSFETMLDLAKTKMRDGYDQAKQAKRQRAVQIIELQDLPKEEEKKSTANPATKGGLQRGATSKTRAKPRLHHLKH